MDEVTNRNDTQRLLASIEGSDHCDYEYNSIQTGGGPAVKALLQANTPENIENETPNVDENGKFNNQHAEEPKRVMSVFALACILSTAFAYGCVLTTLFLITLPVECDRINKQHPNVPKSVALGAFVSIAGVTQLISPLVGALSDTFRPPVEFELGQRMPYLCLGGICSVIGLLGQYVESYEKLWLRYGVFFFLHMVGLNISYAMMISLIPDQVPKSQTGVANGILALLLVTGSLFGFCLFHYFFNRNIQDMYGLYTCIVTISTILTGLYAHDRDAELNVRRWNVIEPNRGSRRHRLILGPWILLRTMLYDPIRNMDAKTLFATYSIDTEKHHDFFVVTVSRLAYYCGISVQTFFLYFLHDIVNVKDDPESAVAYLAVLGQVSGSFICYPVGVASDRLFGGRRKPFVYLSCIMLGSVMLCMIFATTMDQMTLLSLTLGAANGIYLTMDTSLAVDTLPDDYEDGTSGGNAQLLGIWGVAAFCGSAAGPMISGPLLYLLGTPSDNAETDNDQDYTIQGYAVILGLSSVYFLVSALSLRWVKNPKV